MEIIFKYFADFSEKQIEQFGKLEGLYSSWNEKINVISRKDIAGLYEKHILHSLSIAAAFDFQPGTEIIDIGTGGGFPGIPLAIFFPEVKFHLADSIAKKLKVIEAIIQDTGLSNITTQHTRVEDIKGRKFDFAVSRAVAHLKDLWKWSKPLLKSNSSITNNPKPGLICLKGGDLTEEIHDSNTKPHIVELNAIFQEDFFKEKYLLYVKK